MEAGRGCSQGCARLLLRLVQAWRCWGGLETLVSGVSVWRTSICWSTLAASHHQLVSDRYNIQHCLTSLREKFTIYLFLSYYISVWNCFGSQLASLHLFHFVLIREIFEGNCPSFHPIDKNITNHNKKGRSESPLHILAGTKVKHFISLKL